MKGVKLIKDKEGRITEIRVNAQANPEIAGDVYNLISILERLAEDEQQEELSPKPQRMTIEALRGLIQEAKNSGELSPEEFFQLHPEWQKKEKLSSPN